MNVHPSLSSPSFFSYCGNDDDDDEPISTYISLFFFCFSFAKALKYNGIEKKKKKLNELRPEALLYGVASLKNNRLKYTF